MARESPLNPNVEKIERESTARDLAYCDMQGNIFMAAIDQGIAMSDFAPIFMISQLAGVIDYSFSRAGGIEEDDIANYLRMPVLLKSPAIIVDTVMWLHEIVSRMNPGDNLNMTVPRHDRQVRRVLLSDAHERVDDDGHDLHLALQKGRLPVRAGDI